MTQDPDPLLAELLAAETAVWEALVRGDTSADADALSDDFVGLYPDGFHDKDSHVAQLADGATVADYVLSQTRVLGAGPDHALLAYHADYLRAGQVVREAMYVSSLWRRRKGGWVNIFSQDTPADPDAIVP